MDMTVQGARQKHHYIPAFYLRQWIGADGRVCEFSRPYKEVKPRRVHPEGTGYVRGLYTFDALQPAIADFPENRFFLHADERASLVLRMMLGEDFEFDTGTRSSWSRFLMTMIHRNPESIKRISASVSENFKAIFEDVMRTLDRDTSPEDIDLLSDLTGPSEVQGVIQRVLQRIMDSPLLGPVLNDMRWGILRVSQSRYPLLTSDRPIVMTSGLRLSQSHILLPISPNRIFIAANSIEVFERTEEIARSGKLAEHVNDRVVRQARKYVYSTDDRQLRFVARRLGEKIAWSPWE